jgi:hypothetical protein
MDDVNIESEIDKAPTRFESVLKPVARGLLLLMEPSADQYSIILRNDNVQLIVKYEY